MKYFICIYIKISFALLYDFQNYFVLKSEKIYVKLICLHSEILIAMQSIMLFHFFEMTVQIKK